MFVSTHDFWRGLLSAAVLLLMFSARSIASDIQSFDLDGGDATQTLKEFAKQSRLSIVFDPQGVKGVQTQEVVGMLLPRLALERMLEGTPLVFKQDLETGAFAITRSEIPSLDQVIITSESEQKPIQKTDMNAKKNNWFKTLSAVLTLGTTIAGAQPSSDEDQVYDLSPFTIQSDETVGYLATSTLSGTRIKTDLKDLGAAISVVTSELMSDLGATDAATLLSYTTNTEVGGNNGNFTGAEPDAFGRFLQPDARTNPQLNQRIRGLGNADLTRGLFLTDIAFDSYNTDRITVSRGPNSLLFGIGSPGGVIDNSTKQAVHNTDFGEVKFRLDNYGSFRSEIDINRNLIDGRVSLRIAALRDDVQYKQDPAFNLDERFYAALNVILLPNSNSSFLDETRFRANGETGTSGGSPLEIIPPTVGYHNWFEPIPASIQQYIGTTAPLTTVSPSEGGTWEFQALHDDPLGTGSNESRVNTNIHPTLFRQAGIVYATRGSEADVGCCGGIQGFNGLTPWSRSRDTLDSTGLAGTPLAINTFGANAPGDTPVSQVRHYMTNSTYGESYAIGFAAPTLQNRDVFDYRNHMYSNGIDRVSRDFNAVNFALEQSFFKNQAGIEIAYDKQSYKSHQDFPFSGGEGGSTTGPYDISIDNSVYLTNGQLNPNLGRALTRVRGPREKFDEIERETVRVTAFAKLDFREKSGWMKFLGHHQFTGLYNDHTRDNLGSDFRDSINSNEFNIKSALQSEFPDSRRTLNIMAYTSEQSLIGVQSMDDIRLHPIDIQKYEPGYEFNYHYVDTTPAGPLNNGVAGDRTIKAGTAFIEQFLSDQSISRTSIEAKAISWQSYFLDDHIVGLYGYREDDTESFSRNNEDEAGFSRRLPNGHHDPNFTKLSSTPSLVETGDTTTWSVIGRYPEKFMGELPFGMDLQVHYAESENFNPIGLRNNALGQPIGQPTGSTKEYGFLISLDDNKYSIKFNWFETDLADISAGLGFDLANHVFDRIEEHRMGELTGIPWADHIPSGVNGGPASFPIQSYDSWYSAQLGALPQALVDVVNPRQVDTDGDGLWNEYVYDDIPNIGSTQGRVAEGFEVEFVANPTSSWRLMANISKQETVQNDTASVMSETVESYISAVQSARLGELFEDGFLQRSNFVYDVPLFTSILAPIRAAKALDGTVSSEQRKWRFTGVSTYEFSEGLFQGFSVGGAVRWEDSAATGYEFVLEPESGVTIPDLSKPFFGDELFSGDAWITYRKRLFDEKIDWTVQLNVRNLVGESGDIPIKTNPDGQLSVVRIPNPRTVYLSNSFKF
ncbi:MAG: TonB-dependent receptor plug domain-containing protein [Verrucomicrobia bacterium]|nr:TonB-dependent receptor plug domain-containing protein [Verrucomicrobiota bacterium]